MREFPSNAHADERGNPGDTDALAEAFAAHRALGASQERARIVALIRETMPGCRGNFIAETIELQPDAIEGEPSP